MSDWTESANKRRDARHTKGPERSRPKPAKKDTKKWCRGKVGVEHEPKCMQGRFPEYRILACVKCGKELDHYWPARWMTTQPPRPAWVDF